MTDTTTPLFLVVTIYPRLDKLAEAEAQLHRMRAASQQEAGCDFMHLVEGADEDGDTWVMIERFASRAAWDEHMASEHNQRGNLELEPLLRRPSDLQLFHEKLPG
ncbi:MAG TPA: putative quinol monooxygenase [Microlunatus sp.]|jgi:quinol monooxygenase YgiN|nr:putative quinol monooxygenase [Microlunatus sp.]